LFEEVRQAAAKGQAVNALCQMTGLCLNPQIGAALRKGAVNARLPKQELVFKRFDECYRLNFGTRPTDKFRLPAEQPSCMKNIATNPRALGQGWIFGTYQYTGQDAHSYDNWLEHQKP
jgi:hypothetical protein